MKIKISLSIIIASLVLNLLPCGLCLAAEPEVTREYISRKIGGERSEEEKVCADYKNLRIEQGDYIRVSFYNSRGSLIEECEMELSVNDMNKNEMRFNPKTLQGTSYIEIDFICSEYESTGIRIPFKI